MNVFLLMLANVYIQHIKFNVYKVQKISVNTYMKTHKLLTKPLHIR
jgi:hypothetical protein